MLINGIQSNNRKSSKLQFNCKRVETDSSNFSVAPNERVEFQEKHGKNRLYTIFVKKMHKYHPVYTYA